MTTNLTAHTAAAHTTISRVYSLYSLPPLLLFRYDIQVSVFAAQSSLQRSSPSPSSVQHLPAVLSTQPCKFFFHIQVLVI
jgi:hypothetical protein